MFQRNSVSNYRNVMMMLVFKTKEPQATTKKA